MFSISSEIAQFSSPRQKARTMTIPVTPASSIEPARPADCLPAQLQVEAFFDQGTTTVSYVVHDGPGSDCAIIDPVRSFDPASGRTATMSADRIVACVVALGLRCAWLLETHLHPGHFSGASYLQQRLGGKIGISESVVDVDCAFGPLFGDAASSAGERRGFDYLFQPEERFSIGRLPAQALYVQGHTSADTAWMIGDAVFVGATLLMPDAGTARCDFPGGSAPTLYRSIRRLLALPPATRLFTGHDQPLNGRAPAWESTVEEQRRATIHVHDDIPEARFVTRRRARDVTLPTPPLMLAAVQVNLRAGALPAPEKNGVRYLKIPLDQI